MAITRKEAYDLIDILAPRLPAQYRTAFVREFAPSAFDTPGEHIIRDHYDAEEAEVQRLGPWN